MEKREPEIKKKKKEQELYHKVHDHPIMVPIKDNPEKRTFFSVIRQQHFAMLHLPQTFFFLTMSCTNKDSTFLITNVEEGTRNPNKKKQELYCKIDDHLITVPSKDIPEKRAFSLSH